MVPIKTAGGVCPTAVGVTLMNSKNSSRTTSSRNRFTSASTRQDRSAGEPFALDWFSSDLRLVAIDALIYMTVLLHSFYREKSASISLHRTPFNPEYAA